MQHHNIPGTVLFDGEYAQGGLALNRMCFSFNSAAKWLGRKKPDVAVVFHNDHGLNFFLDKLPTFAVGAASEYRKEDQLDLAFDAAYVAVGRRLVRFRRKQITWACFKVVVSQDAKCRALDVIVLAALQRPQERS